MARSDKIITQEQALGRMARLCAQKECCALDIRRKLMRMNFPDEVIQKIIGKLEKENYLNEERYTRVFISDKLRFNKWGKAKIVAALRQKNVPTEVIEHAFSEFPDESLNQSLQSQLEKKRKTITGNSEYEKNGKLIRFALSRGFAMSEILKCMRNMKLHDVPDEL